MLKVDTGEFLDRFDRGPFRIGHDLDGRDDLFGLDAIVALAGRLDADQVEYNLGDLDIVSDPEAARTPSAGVLETIRNIDRAGSWVALKRPETDPAYRELHRRLVAELDPLVSAVDSPIASSHLYLFVSSAGAVTPLHNDLEYGTLLQIRGAKTITFLDRDDPEVLPHNDHALATEGHRNLQVPDAVLERGVPVGLEPGGGVHLPWNVPHWVAVGDDDWSVSLSLTFQTRRTQTEIELHRINRTLAGLGMHPRPVGASPAADATKHAVWRAGRGLKHVLR